MPQPTDKHDDKSYWLDDPKNVRNLSIGLVVVCGALVLLDFVIHKHPHYPIEERFGFYGWFGFISFTCIVLAGKYMRRIVHREEDYYDH